MFKQVFLFGALTLVTPVYSAVDGQTEHLQIDSELSQQDFIKENSIPTGSDLIYTYTATSSASISLRHNFYSGTTCSGGVQSYFVRTSTFTSGQTWYLSGAALANYVTTGINTGGFIESGSWGFINTLAGSMTLSVGAGTPGSCTALGSKVSGNFQSSGTPGSL